MIVVLLLALVAGRSTGDAPNNRLGLSNTNWRRFLIGFLVLELFWALYLATQLF